MYLKNKINLGFSIIIILCLSLLVNADEGSFIVDGDGEVLVETGFISSCGSINGSYFEGVYVPHYIGVNETGIFKIFAKNSSSEIINSTDSLLQIGVLGTWYNMSFDTSKNYWYAYLSSDVEEDITFNVSLSSTVYNCVNDTLDVKFREPFFVQLNLYTVNKTDGKPEPYENDFHYIYFKINEDLEVNMSSALPSAVDINKAFNTYFGFIPGMDKLYPETNDYSIVFWGDYSDGVGTVKLYENSTYDIYLMTQKVKTNIPWSFEFYKPQQTKIKIDSQIASYTFEDKEDTSLEIYMDMWEVDKVGIIMNIVRTLIIVGLVIVGLGLIAMLPGGTKIVGGIVPIALALMFKLLGVL